MQKKIYHSNEMGEMLELSARPILWDVCNFDEFRYFVLVEDAVEKLTQRFKTQFYLLGRSARHVCVENTCRNRCRFDRMVEKVNKEQQRIINLLNKE